jgi:hypothetical protein
MRLKFWFCLRVPEEALSVGKLLTRYWYLNNLSIAYCILVFTGKAEVEIPLTKRMVHLGSCMFVNAPIYS